MKAVTPKYIRVRDAILAEIRGNRLEPGDRIPTRESLMKTHQVSRVTIEAALRELIRSGALVTSKRGGTVVTDSPPPLMAAVVSNIDEEELKAAQGEPHGVLALSRILTAEPKNWCLRFLKADSLKNKIATLSTYDAVVWLQPDESSMQSLESLGRKAIVMNRYPEKNSFVSTNHREAVKQLSLHAFETCGSDFQTLYLEHERTGKSFVQDKRRSGFVEACAEKKIFYRLCELPYDHEKSIAELSYLPLDPDKKTVFVSGTCVFAGAVLRLVEERKLKLNENCFYADFDNDHSLYRTGRQITTVTQDYPAIGAKVIEALDIVAKGEYAKIFVPHILDSSFKCNQLKKRQNKGL